MNDAYERRTLLQQLGSILEMLVHVKEHEYELQTVGELVRRYKRLTEVPLLCHVAQTMTLRELEHRTLRAFCRWPELLLETKLDQVALASPVKEWLFDDYAFGWESYAATLTREVPWFETAAAAAAT